MLRAVKKKYEVPKNKEKDAGVQWLRAVVNIMRRGATHVPGQPSDCMAHGMLSTETDEALQAAHTQFLSTTVLFAFWCVVVGGRELAFPRVAADSAQEHPPKGVQGNIKAWGGNVKVGDQATLR